MSVRLLSSLMCVIFCLTTCFVMLSKWTFLFLKAHRGGNNSTNSVSSKSSKNSMSSMSSTTANAGNDELVCPPKYYARMLTSSFLFLINVIQGYYKGLFDCSTWILVCWMNSINYWRFPTPGMRRNIDLLSSLSATYHHYMCSYEIEDGYIYRIGLATFCGWYMMSLYFGRIAKKPHYASICHVNIHSTAIVFNVWFFSVLYRVRSSSHDHSKLAEMYCLLLLIFVIVCVCSSSSSSTSSSTSSSCSSSSCCSSSCSSSCSYKKKVARCPTKKKP